MLRAVLLLMSLWGTALIQTAQAQPRLSPGEVFAESFILIDADSKRVLADYRADERMNPASITKLMTAYVVYKMIQDGYIALDDKTIITATARNMTTGSRMFLERGSAVSINELLHGLVIQSGNDAAIALAEAIAGSEKKFTLLMNKYAETLGMKNSHFKNVTGLTAEGHYMSAADIATLARAIILEFPEHYKLYKQNEYTWNGITQQNRNALLRIDPNVDGLKTGYTEAAGYCLTASAKRGKMRLISVVLGTQSVGARVRASKKVLSFGFDNFSVKTLFKAGQKISSVTVDGGETDSVDIAIAKPINLPVAKADKGKISAQLVLSESLSAPLSKGQTVGNIIIKQGDTVLAHAPAITLQAVEESGFFSQLWDSLF